MMGCDPQGDHKQGSESHGAAVSQRFCFRQSPRDIGELRLLLVLRPLIDL